MSENQIFKAQFKTGETVKIVKPNAQAMLDSCEANIGRLQGSVRKVPAILCDGAYEDEQWLVMNIIDDQGLLLDHMAVKGAVSDGQAMRLCHKYFNVQGTIRNKVVMSDNALKTFLDGANLPSGTPYILENDALLLDSMGSVKQVQWNDGEITSHDGSLSRLMLDMARCDTSGELTQKMTPRDIVGLVIDETCELSPMLDAIVIKNRQLEMVIQKMAEALKAHDSDQFFVKTVTPIEPFKRQGVVNVGAIFEMSDTQTITVLFNNPDTTPAKLTGDDVLTSWKWMLNKRDVTAVLQPRAVDAKKYPIIAQRMTQLLAKNHARFERAQLALSKEELLLSELVTQVESAQSELRSYEIEMNRVQAEIDAIATRKLNDTEVGKVDTADTAAEDPTLADDFDPTTPENYALIVGNEERLEDYQDHLDSFFQGRGIDIRNNLRELGWDGERFKELSKDGHTLKMDFKVKGGGRNIVGITYRVTDTPFNLADDLTHSPEAFAKLIDDALTQADSSNEQSVQMSKYSIKSTNPRARKPVGSIKVTARQDGTFDIDFALDGIASGIVGTLEIVQAWIAHRMTGLGSAISGKSVTWDDVKGRISLTEGEDHLNVAIALENDVSGDDGNGVSGDDGTVKLSGDEFGEFDLPEDKKELRAAAKTALSEMIGKAYPCPALNADVEVRKNGVKKVISTSSDPRKLQAIAGLAELLNSAEKVGELESYAPKSEQNIKAYHILASKLNLEGKDLYVRFVIREDDKGQYYYDHRIENDVLKEMLKNAKSPLLDGLSTAVFQTAGVSQDELAKLTRIANCRLNYSIENNQNEVNAMLDDVNASEVFVLNMFIVEDTENKQNVQMNNDELKPEVIATEETQPAARTGKVFKKEAENLWRSIQYSVIDLQGHTRDEFQRANVKGRLEPKIAEAEAMLQRAFRDDWQREQLESWTNSARKTIERWEGAQGEGEMNANTVVTADVSDDTGAVDDGTLTNEGTIIEQPEPSLEANPEQKFLEDMLAGTVDLLADETGEKLEKIGENLSPELEDLFNQAVDAYSDAALNNAKNMG